MTTEGFIVRIALVVILSAVLAAGQSGRQRQSQTSPPTPPTADEAPAVVSLETIEVVVPVTVRNRYGRPIVGLSKADFILYEEGRRQEITGFETDSVPANIVMLLDVSGSVRTEINDIRLSALALIGELSPRDQVCIIQFNDRVQLVQDWTSDKLKLERALLQLPATGNTAFYNALYEAATKRLAQAAGRRFILLFTDGVDTYEGKDAKTAAEALEAIQRAEASVYVISKTRAIREYLTGQRAFSIFKVLDPLDPYIQQYLYALEQAEQWLIELAERTGGQIYFPRDQSELRGVYGDLAQELSSQYVLRYVPQNTNFDGRFRRIRVVTGNPAYIAYAREGYYAVKK